MTDKVKLTQEEYDDLVELINDDNLDIYDILGEIKNIWDDKFIELDNNLFGNITTELDREKQVEFIKDPLSYVEAEKKKYYVHLIKNNSCGYLNIVLNTGEVKLYDKLQADGYKTQFTKDELNNMKNLAFTINEDALEEIEDGKE